MTVDYVPQEGSLAAEVCDLLRRQPDLEELSVAEIIRRFPERAKSSNVNPCLATPLTHRVLVRLRNTRGELVYRRGPHFSGKPKPAPVPPVPAPRVPAPAAEQSNVAGPAHLAPKPADGLEFDGRGVLVAKAASAPPPAPAPEPAAPAPIPTLGHPTAIQPAPAHPRSARAAKAGVPVKRLPPIDVTKLKPRTDVPIPTIGQSPKGVTKYDDVFGLLKQPGASVEVDIAYYGALQKAAKTYGKAHKRRLVIRRVDAKTCGIWWLATGTAATGAKA